MSTQQRHTIPVPAGMTLLRPALSARSDLKVSPMHTIANMRVLDEEAAKRHEKRAPERKKTGCRSDSKTRFYTLSRS